MMIIDERDEYAAADVELAATDGVRADHIAALSTIAGAVAIGVCFWDAVPRNMLAAWAAAATALTILQWQASRWPLESRREPDGVSVRLIALSLGAGSFWGIAGLTLSPAASLPQQAMLAVVLISVTALQTTGFLE